MKTILSYFNRDEISNSDLNLFDKSPLLFKLKKDKLLESVTSKSLELGTLIHMAILEPENFIVADISKPTTSMLKYIETLYSTKNKDKAYIASGYKISQERVEAKMKDVENLEYYKFLQRAEGKLVLSEKEREIVDGIDKATHSNRTAYKFLYDTSKGYESFNELEVFFTLGGVKCKSKIDRLLIDKENKRVWLIDLKTTSKPLYGKCNRISETGILKHDWHVTGFPASILTYNYHRQAVFYSHAVRAFLEQNGYNSDEYKLSPYIIAVAIYPPYECVVYEIPTDWFVDAELEIAESLFNYTVCRDSNIWKPCNMKEGLIQLGE